MTLLEKLQTSLADRYRIEREVGVGGMATVYLAHDLRHDRDVALKLLKPELGAVLGPERFLSEIRVTAKLQHPNLLPLFDSGESEGQLWYVMPNVEGESLRARMDRERQLSVREAVRIATLVAGALDYAHRHGVIHRDLKPENILLSDDQPLVADFGIALAVSNAGGERVTQTGLSLGTPQYMSPEQATGERGLDGRTDIYSLGAVLYEMLTGEPPHTGATVQAITARLMTETPRSIRATRSSVPEHVDWAVQKALEKVPADRFETAKEFAETLLGQKAITASRTAAFVPEGKTSGLIRGSHEDSRLAWIVASVAGALAISAGAFSVREARQLAAVPPPEPASFTVTPAASESFNTSFVAVSPDGRRVVYGGDNEKGSQLYSRTMDDVESHPIPGTDGADLPFFSPDSKWLAFFAGGNLVRVPIDGGSTLTVARNLIPVYAWWAMNNRIILPTQGITRQRAGLSEVSPSGGVPKILLVSDTIHRENMRAGYDLPDGDHFLFASLGPGGIEDDNLAIGSFKSKDYKVLDFLIAKPLGFLDGNAIVLQFDGTQGTIFAVPLSLRNRTMIGDPVTLRSGIMTQMGVALSRTGTLAYVNRASGAQLVWLDGTGKTDTLLADVRAYGMPRLSPDGSRVAVWLPGTLGEVWIYSIHDKTFSRLISAAAVWPEWTADGKKIVFVRTQTAAAGIYVQAADGSGEAERLNVKLPPKVAPIWAGLSPDQSTILFSAAAGAQRRNIYYFKPGVDDVAKPWLATDFDETAPRFSPDGKWVAYASDESGSAGFEVYVRPFPGPGSRVQISSGGGQEPVWSHNGRKIFYRNVGRVMAAEVATGLGTLSVTARRPVLLVSAPGSEVGANYDISPDGNRILIGKPAGGEAKLIVVTNWFTEVRRKLKQAGQK